MSGFAQRRSFLKRLGRIRLSLAAATVLLAPILACAISAGDSPVAQNPIAELGRSEIEMWKLINRDRASRACAEETRGRARPLEWDDRLAAVAREHSEEMARHGFFSHTGIDGSLAYMRVSRAGIPWSATGENIAMYPDVTRAEAEFMNEPKFEPNHRGNILNPSFTHVGVGIARGRDGVLYITQEFAALR